MYKIILFVVACLAIKITNAQISIIQHPFVGFEIKSDDIFKGDIINSSSEPINLFLTGTITDLTSGKMVLTAQTKVFSAAQGLTHISASTLEPQYTIYSTAIEQTGIIPYGVYQICIKAIKLDGKEEAGSSCKDHEVMVMSPPILISPNNESVVTEPYPVLVWSPPTPVTKNKVQYDLKLVEILPNQTPFDAWQRNFGMIELTGIQSTSLLYPSNAMKLEDGKRYAWKIIARDQSQKVIGETEVWWFEKKSPSSVSTPKQEESMNFIKMKPGVENDFVYARNELRLIYNKEYNVKQLTFIIKTIDGKNQEQIVEDKVIRQSDNKVILSLKGLTILKPDAFFIVEAKDEETKESQFLVFKCIGN